MRVLGIETSCDETAVAIYDAQKGLMAHVVYSQIATHCQWGGVVPELASRDHLRKIIPLIRECLEVAQCDQYSLEGIAYTKGPGLIGALMVGAAVGRSLGYALRVPTIGVHHLEAHLMAVMLEAKIPTFPFLTLLVSGGHTVLIEAQAFGQYRLLGETVDDAVGEAFDKVAKALGLAYPGGPELEKLAASGNAGRFHFSRPMQHQPTLNFSFSGLKTQVITRIHAQPSLDTQTKADIAYAFQEAVIDTLITKTKKALKQTQLKQLAIVGGVSANQTLRVTFTNQCDADLFFPRPIFCTDNGAMVAYTGHRRLCAGDHEALHIEVKPRWPLAIG